MLTYSFSKREKTLILVLVLVAVFVAWYGLIYRGAANEITRIESEIETTNTSIELDETRLAQMKNMQASIEQHKAAGTAMTDIPEYDNIKPLMGELDTIMRKTSKYSLSFDAIDTTSSDYVLRGVSMSFTCDTYADAEDIVRDIANGTYPCIINSVAVSPERSGGHLGIVALVEGRYNEATEGQTSVNCSVHVTFFEKPNAEQKAAKEASA